MSLFRAFPAMLRCFCTLLFVAFSAAVGNAQNAGPPTLPDILQIGSIDSLTISPDGNHAAFRVLRPSIEMNRVQVSWYRIDLSGAWDVKLLGRAGSPRLYPMFDMPLAEHPIWTKNDQILVQLQDADGVQVHLLGPDGQDRMITNDPADIERFEKGDEIGSLRIWVRNSRREIAARQIGEERDGIHFDKTVPTEGMKLTRNFLDGLIWQTERREDDQNHRPFGSGDLREKHVSLPSDVQLQGSGSFLDIQSVEPFKAETLDHLLEVGRIKVGLREISAGDTFSPPRYRIGRYTMGKYTPCKDPSCTGNGAEIRLMVRDGHGHVLILREDYGSGQMFLLTLNVHSLSIIKSVAVGGSLDGGVTADGSASCAHSGSHLLCVRSGPTAPPALVDVDVEHAEFRTVFNPNVELAAKTYPKVVYLTWKDRFDRISSGYLIKPEGETKPVPLVITGYRCRGFLNGGLSQLAPEFILAQRGFAVLCANSNSTNNRLPPEDASEPVLKAHKADIEGYRSIIYNLGRTGIIDPDRVGIAGQSYSANVIAYAISHTNLFKVAVMGTGTSIDSDTYWITAPAPDAWRRRAVLEDAGLPDPRKDIAGIWKKIAPSENADKVHAALLLQPPEAEYYMALRFYSAIRDHGGAADMFVYPNAAHTMQRYPTQQLARAQRSVDWFTFWLGGKARRDEIIGHYPMWKQFSDKASLLDRP